MPKDSLEKMMREAYRAGKADIERGEESMPFVRFITADGKRIGVEIPQYGDPALKATIRMTLRKAMREAGAVEYVISFEAWISKREMGEKIDVMPSEDPLHTEALSLMGGDKHGLVMAALGEIKNVGGGKRVVMRMSGPKDSTLIEGPLASLLYDKDAN